MAGVSGITADFSADTTTGTAPLTVAFTDESTGGPAGWAWYFGDETYLEPWSGNSSWTGRYGHSSVVMPDGSIVLLGGSDSTGYKNDTWRSTNNGVSWTLMNESSGWLAREAFSSVAMPDGSIVLMGGRDDTLQNDVWRSADYGATWTRVNESPGWTERYGHSSVVMPDGSIVLTGGSATDGYKNDIWMSADRGESWAQINASPGWTQRYGHSSVVMTDGSIVLTGGSATDGYKNDIWMSADRGESWAQINASPGWTQRYGHSSVVMLDGRILLIGGSDDYDTWNDVWQSTDNGESWAQINASAGWSARYLHTSVALPDGSILLTCGTDSPGTTFENDIWRSTDYGATWTKDNTIWTARYQHTSVVMPDGSIILTGGYDGIGGNAGSYKNDVWRSTDSGVTWTLMNSSAGWSGRIGHSSVAMPDGSIVIMGGYSYAGDDMNGIWYQDNDVWRSTDNGATWTQMTANPGWRARSYASSVVMPDGSIVLMGGFSSFNEGDVWRSTDNGATWTQMNESAGWSERSCHTSVAMPDGSIVLMGGINLHRLPTGYNDTWRSTDNGATWTRMTERAGWSGRHLHTSVVMPDGSILLMGGSDGNNNNDIWRSMDEGASWTRVTTNAGWTPRHGQTSVIMPDGSILLIGGNDGTLRNDVWKFMPAGSTEQNPTHTYTIPGNYTVGLQVYDASGYTSTRKTDYISIPITDLTAVEFSSVGQSDVIDGVPVYWEAQNRGTVVIENNWTDTVYLSADESLDTGDIGLSSYAQDRTLLPGESYSVSDVIGYAGTVPDGMYYLILSIDERNPGGGVNEPGKIISRPIQIGSEKIFNETTTQQTSLTADVKRENITLDDGQVSGDLAGTFSLSSGELFTITSGSFTGQGIFRGGITTTLDGQEYYGTLKGVLVPDTENDRLLLKGTISGNELNGLFDSSMTESVPDSGNYDRVNATWRLNRFAGDNQSVVLESSGNISTTDPITYPSTALDMVQTTLSGNVSGDYGDPVTITITHVTVVDAANPYDGYGFATLSYVSQNGQGEGWLATREISPGIHDLRGMFSKPLAGIATGSITSSSPKSFSIAVQRTDLGSVPVPDLSVRIWSPQWFSPGETITYTIEYSNAGLKSATNVPVVLELPDSVDYLSSSGNGEYYQYTNEVIWNLSSVPANTRGLLVVQALVKWGLVGHSIHTAYAYSPLNEIVVWEDPSSDFEIVQANNTFVTVRFFNESTEGLIVLSSNVTHHQDAITPTLSYSKEGQGTRYIWNYSTATHSYNWNELQQWVHDNAHYVFEGYNRYQAVKEAQRLINEHQKYLDWLVDRCLISPETRSAQIEKYKSFKYMPWLHSLTGRVPGPIGQIIDGIYINGLDHLWLQGARNILLDEINRNIVINQQDYVSCNPPDRLPIDITSSDQVHNYYLKHKSTTSSTATTEVITAGDPNAKYGPEGHVLQGQPLDYKIEFENVGEGTAYGVYFIDTLDANLDDSTLTIGPVYNTSDSSLIAPPGTYDPGTRTITWQVGKVGSQMGGYANISINVMNDAIDGTQIINYGIVYFPSVPEETRTNSIVSIVGANYPPEIPDNPGPAINDDTVTAPVYLSWTCDDPNGDTLRYDIYFGNSTPPELLLQDSFQTSAFPGGIEYNKTYYWQVVAKDPEGAVNESPVWSFRSAPLTLGGTPEKIGIFRPSARTWYLDNSGNGAYGAGDLSSKFGGTADLQVSGDWNGNGISEIGVFRPATHTWYLDSSGNGAYGEGDLSYKFGGPADLPVSGDWNDDDVTEIGVFRPATHTWYLDNSSNGAYGAGDLTYKFGGPADLPVSGDWNDDGISEIGVFRPSTHTWYLDNSSNGAYGPGDLTYRFGGPADLPVSGDWNDDSISEIGVFRPSTHTWYLDNSSNGAYGAGDLSYKFGGASDRPVSGKWG